MTRRQLRNRYPFHNQPLRPIPEPQRVKPPQPSLLAKILRKLGL